MIKRNITAYSVIIICAAVLFIPFLGAAHLFDWDEINFAECAREMIRTGNYLRVQIDYQPFWEKPPLFIWLQVLCMKAFGVNEFAARLPNALVGIATLCTVYHVGKKTVNEKMAQIWVLFFAASWLPHFYFKSGIIDPLFNLLIFLAVYKLHRVKFSDRKTIHSIFAGVFLGLAVLTKGPVAILVAGIVFVIYLLLQKGFRGFPWRQILIIALFTILTTASWFAVEIILHGWKLVGQFIEYQVRLLRTEDAGHGGPFYYHWIILLLGCFPASVFLLQRQRIAEPDKTRDMTRWMWLLFWVVLLLFSLVKTKIVHYSSLCYFPLTYLASLQASRFQTGSVRIKNWVLVTMGVIGSLIAITITAIPLIGINKDKLVSFFNDPFAVANLQAAVPWSYSECIWGILYLVGLIAGVILLRKNFRNGLLVIGLVQLIIIQVTVIHFTPKIEGYSQRAAIEFYKQFRGKDVYVYPLGFKSYAHLFYTDKQPYAGMQPTEDMLLHGSMSKPVYIITKVTDSAQYAQEPTLEMIGEKNGFVFFRRK